MAGTTYAIDPAHTSVEFIVRHMMISKVRGRFSDISGTIVLDVATGTPSEIDVAIGVDSIDTREAKRDEHLKSGDFFDSQTFKHLTFKSSSITSTGAQTFTMGGALTIHGVTNDVTFEGTYGGGGKDPWGNHRVGYEAETTINRKDFGLEYNAALEAGGFMIGEDVKIELNVEAVPA